MGEQMKYLVTIHTDIGIKKATNQDSALIRIANTDYGRVLLAAICDGMGGLAKGEVASAALTRALSEWFEDELPDLLLQGLSEDNVNQSLDQLVLELNMKIAEYGTLNRLSLGTTAAIILLVGNYYYIMNIGDSRVYMIKEQLQCLTKDQTFIQREMDKGKMTYEEALISPQRNVLLQCVGASTVVTPDFYSGTFEPNTVFMLCSDGFRHLITEQELYDHLNPYYLKTESIMSEQAKYLTDLNKYRQETDNITVALIRVC